MGEAQERRRGTETDPTPAFLAAPEFCSPVLAAVHGQWQGHWQHCAPQAYSRKTIDIWLSCLPHNLHALLAAQL
jgi:hypothetical protein